MKNLVVSFLAAAVLAVFLMSCVSMQDREMTPQERAETHIVGTVSTSFTSFQFLHIQSRRQLRRRAHTELLRLARQQYGINAEVRNITIQGGVSGWQALYVLGIPVFTTLATFAAVAPLYPGDGIEGLHWGLLGGGGTLLALNLVGNFQRITVTGDVVMHGAGAVPEQVDQRLPEAVNAASEALIASMPQNATVAILNVHSRDPAAASFILDEVEFRLITSGRFSIVDRQRLEQIRIEQNFHLSGEVSDASAASIGNLLGASIVITGDIGTDLLGNRLTLRALDVNTGQIVTMALERF